MKRRALIQSRAWLLKTWRFGGMILLLALCFSSGGPGVRGAESIGVKEYQVKAAFIYNFLKFVEWPAEKLTNLDSPLIIGVVGNGPVAIELGKIVSQRRINGRGLMVRPIESPEAAGEAHALFIAANEDHQVKRLLANLAPASVLTIGESELFAQRGGMIHFIVEGDKLRFEINLEAAEAARLKISAQLLKLARTIRRKP